MRSVTGRRVVSDGIGLNVVEFGGSEGPPLLFVHGAYGHARVWDLVIEHLPQSWEIVAFDLPGHGDSETPLAAERYEFERLTGDLLSVVHTLSAAPVIVGHSVGSALAMSFGIAHPRLAAGLVLVDIDPHPPRFQIDHLHDAGSKPPKRYPARERAVAREARVAPEAESRVHEHLADHGYRLDHGEWVQKFDQTFLATLEHWNLTERLAAIEVPTLVLRGSDTIVMTDEGFEDLTTRIPGARGEIVEGGTHQLHLDRPERVAASIRRFVEELRR